MINKAYELVTGAVDHQPVEKKPEVPDAVREQLLLNWKRSTITKELMDSLSREVENLESQARSYACSYPQHNNHHQIINALVRASELRKVIEKWNLT